ncbi:MAG: Transcription termination protein NusB [uncultured Thermomicrobiales bacterium]|uniref:Transcription antitermination protein NusB n=1 Tax=uncultured Thermomicrobiales bacterium TaxID=1645740 RepID=A0A6J4U3H0_9BACT|nr:MAG: Transcription termination protein NusB [uncultured Thermomicrobiales bacterium]
MRDETGTDPSNDVWGIGGAQGAAPKPPRSEPAASEAMPPTDAQARQGPPVEAPRPIGVGRHQARVAAVQMLFEVDATDHPIEEVLDREEIADEELPPPVSAQAARLVRGVLAAQAEIDPRIFAAAPAFPVSQLPAVDRAVLRLAIHELLNAPEVPVKTAINEAVEIAKRFGGDSSGRFVNGVLGTIASSLDSARRPPQPAPPRPKGKGRGKGQGNRKTGTKPAKAPPS